MSQISRQRTCPACGQEIREGELTSIEALIDPSVRYIVVHWGHSTFTKGARNGADEQR